MTTANSSGRILLIDDDVDLRETFADALADLGFVVVCAVNGRDALDKLTADPLPDVILLDLVMPVMNGWQFCEQRKAIPRLASIPVIALSAAASKDPLSPYYLEVDDFLAKPVTLNDLACKLASYTGFTAEARRTGL